MLRAIWAQSIDGIIGDGNDMPWHLPEDLTHFKDLTMGSTVIMGRATWESIPERFRPLPGRENWVVTSKTPGQWLEGARAIALTDISRTTDAWIIGGGKLYAATLPLVAKVERTLIDAPYAAQLGDQAVLAPTLDAGFVLSKDSGWQVASSGLRYRFETWVRNGEA
ncbi:dihydrofolate reductase [Corynebacterium kozikiae]|uniref:dihydrofolate reductase n=1 Tax=Corynebacterium kozikiae TaxID=2968469 RepID=UPI00211C29C2|nr:dihydrofolate reductase [Corynebacterium sp. 76QC2CO]MCQ9344180.1 dihydrofolate reductase [Corynebacterium sp. 76QC2CO]